MIGQAVTNPRTVTPERDERNMQHILIRQYPEHTVGPVILNDSENSKVVVTPDLAARELQNRLL